MIKIKKSDEKIFNLLPDGILIFEIDSKQLLFANEYMCNNLGYSQNDFIQFSLFNVHPVEAIDYAISQYLKLFKNEINTVSFIPFISKGSKILYFDVTGKKIIVGDTNCFLGIFRNSTEVFERNDTTNYGLDQGYEYDVRQKLEKFSESNLLLVEEKKWERHRLAKFNENIKKYNELTSFIPSAEIETVKVTEQILIENQNFLNSIYNSVPIIIFILNRIEQKVVFINNQIFSILGYLPEEICNTPLTELKKIIVDFKDNLDSNFLSNIPFEKGFFERLIRIKHKKTGLKWMNVRFVEFKSDKAGNAVEIICLATDVTEQKQNERKLNAMMRLSRMQDKRTQKIRTLSLIQGQEEERRRISRDIHDGIGQMLTALKLNIENFNESSFSTINEKAKCDRVKELIRETIAEARRISNALAPPVLYDFGLYSVTKHLLEQVSKSSEIKIHFDSNIQNIRYLPLIEVTLYRIIQESINNILKHSQAENIYVTINQDVDSLNLLVIDDGVGLNYIEEGLNQNKTNGKGLRNIKERALLIGAKINIISKPGDGCMVKMSIQLKNCIPK